MYIHAGADRVIRDREIIGFFDMDGKNYSGINNEFLKKAEKNGKVYISGEDLPRTFILKDNGEVILTHISTAALSARSEKKKF